RVMSDQSAHVHRYLAPCKKPGSVELMKASIGSPMCVSDVVKVRGYDQRAVRSGVQDGRDGFGFLSHGKGVSTALGKWGQLTCHELTRCADTVHPCRVSPPAGANGNVSDAFQHRRVLC